jgi:glycosyltransferase involved in cell wall biosynthesis
MTMMVRNEADIVTPVLDHHLAHGVDHIIVTDNGSTDGTAEILAGYEQRGLIDLRYDASHRKQQSPVVTAMARDAHERYGADWVINVDADEFFVPLDRRRTLAEVFAELSPEIVSFTAPVTNLIGPPARRGTGLQRLVYRDHRPVSELEQRGLLSQPIPNAVHIGHPEVVVGQGNHLVSLPSQGAPPEELGIEVLHLPWRSWEQFRSKVDMAGRGYESNPGIIPGPDHHGMRDWARLQNETLLYYYLVRHPLPEELDAALVYGWAEPEPVLADALTSPVADEPFDDDDIAEWRRVAPIIAQAESGVLELRRAADRYAALQRELDDTRQRVVEADERTAAVEKRLQTEKLRTEMTAVHVDSLESELAGLRDRPEVRVSNKVRRVLRRGARS